MAEIFYRTYPKKLNKDKSDLGFVEISDLDKWFMLAKILGIDCLIIEDIFKKDKNNFNKNKKTSGALKNPKIIKVKSI